jgi:hypothetical protein
MATINTTSVMNGLRLEHEGGNEITITAETPTKVGIDVLIKELLTFLPSSDGEGEEKNHLLSLHQAPYKRPEVRDHIPEPA